MAKKSKAAKTDTATLVEEFTAGQRDRMIRLIEDLQRERESLVEHNSRLVEIIRGELIVNPYYVDLQRRHQTVMGMIGQVREQLKALNARHLAEMPSYESPYEDSLKWINEIIDMDQLAQ